VPPVFDPDKCPVEEIERISDFVFIDDCAIPQSPPVIHECPDIGFAMPGGGPGGPGSAGTGSAGPPGPPGGDGKPKKVTVECVEVEGEITDSDECGLDEEGKALFEVLQFRKDCSFRLYCIDEKTVVVDLGGGPSYSVFWQPPGGGCPQWTTCPEINHSVKIGIDEDLGWLRLSGVKADGGEFRMASSGEQSWRMPDEAPSDHSSHLYAGAVSGSCVKLAWTEPGKCGMVYLVGYESSCGEEADQKCIMVELDRGLIKSADVVTVTDCEEEGEADCEMGPCEPHKPCE
jgi:hypothetical protein